MNDLIEKAQKASSVKESMALITTVQKNEALETIAAALLQEKAFLLSENEKDLENGRASGLSDTLIDRLRLTDQRLQGMADGLHQVAQLDDPVGETLESWSRPNGLKIKSIRVPLGVVGMVYEARPNVTVDATALCLKTGNAVLLRGSSSALHSNMALVHVIKQALKETAIPVDAVQLLEDTRRETANQMFKLNEYLDVLIPRGGAGLIQTVVQNATIPVLETGVGNCHVYIDDTALTEMAISIAVNAKVQRPSVCNAAETIVVHEKWAHEHLNELIDALKSEGVEIHGDDYVVETDSSVVPATEDDWSTEFLDLAVAVKIVDSFEEALNHINLYSTKHSEAIISETPEHVEAFFARIDAAALYHNASTRFTDGFEFGFGAEIGISTQKLHARGPMGLIALTSYKYLIVGTGQIKK